MAKEKQKKVAAEVKGAIVPFDRRNWALFFVGLAVIIVGYIFLSIGPAKSFWSLTLAPILLVAGYCVIVPIAILIRKKRSQVKVGD